MSSEWWNEAWFGQLFASESDSLAPEAVEEDTTQEVTQERSETLHQDAVNEDKQSFQFGTLLPEVLTSLLSPRVLGGKEEGSYEDQFASASSPSREKELEDLVDEARLSSDLMPSSAAPVSTSTLERVDTPPSAIPNSTKVDSTLAPARPERLKRGVPYSPPSAPTTTFGTQSNSPIQHQQAVAPTVVHMPSTTTEPLPAAHRSDEGHPTSSGTVEPNDAGSTDNAAVRGRASRQRASGARKGDGAMRPPAAQAASSKRLLPAILNAAAKSKAAVLSPQASRVVHALMQAAVPASAQPLPAEQQAGSSGRTSAAMHVAEPKAGAPNLAGNRAGGSKPSVRQAASRGTHNAVREMDEAGLRRGRERKDADALAERGSVASVPPVKRTSAISGSEPSNRARVARQAPNAAQQDAPGGSTRGDIRTAPPHTLGRTTAAPTLAQNDTSAGTLSVPKAARAATGKAAPPSPKKASLLSWAAHVRSTNSQFSSEPAETSQKHTPSTPAPPAASAVQAASPRQEGGELPKLAADQGTGAAPGSALTVRLPASGTARPAVQSAAAASASPRPNAAAKQAANAALEPAASGVKSGGSVAAAVRKVVVEADRPMAADVEQKLLGSDEGAPLQAPRGGTHHTSAARPEDAPRGNAPSPSFSVVRGATASPSDSDPTAALGAPTSAVGGVGLSEPDHVAVPCAGAAAVEAVGLSAHNPAAVPGAGAAAVEAVGLSARNPAAVPGAQAGAAVKTGGASEASEGAHVHQGAKGFEELFASHSAPSWIAQWKSSLRPDGVDPARRWTFGGPAPLTSPEPHRLRGGTAGTRVSPLLKIPAVVRGSEGAPSWTHPHRSPSNSCSKVTLVPPSPRPGQRSKDGRTEAVEQAGMRSSPSPGTRRQQSMKNATAGGGGGGLAAPRMSPSARGYTQKPASDVPDAKGGSMTSTALMRMDWAELGFPPVDCGAPGDEPAESSVPWRQADSSLASCVFGMELSDWLFASTATRVPARAEVAQEAQCIPLAAPHRGSESAMPAEEEHAAAGSPHDVPDDDPLAAFLGADDGDDFWLSAGGQDGLSAGVQDSLSAGGQDSPAAAAHSAEVRDTFDTTAPVQPEGDAVAEAASPAEGAGAGWRRHHTMTPGDGGTFEEAFAALFGAEPPSAEEGGPACGGVSRGTVDLEETVHGDDGGSSSSLDLTVYGGDGRSLAASTETVRGLDCGSSDGLGETARGDDSGSSGDWMMRVHIGDGGSSADLEEAASAGDISSSDHPDRGVTAHDGDGGGLGDSGRARAGE
ncbi:hypothetical protein CYMTET_26846, partial [Cymbomonas tetramitiformis]